MLSWTWLLLRSRWRWMPDAKTEIAVLAQAAAERFQKAQDHEAGLSSA